MHLTKKEHFVELIIMFHSGVIGLIIFGLVLQNQLVIFISSVFMMSGIFGWIITAFSKKQEYHLSKIMIFVEYCTCFGGFTLYFISIFKWDQIHQEFLLFITITILIITFYDTACYYSKKKEI